jgi:hypothetical protein
MNKLGVEENAGIGLKYLPVVRHSGRREKSIDGAMQLLGAFGLLA